MKDLFKMSQDEIRFVSENLTQRDWFNLLITRKLSEDFLREFQDNIHIGAFLHGRDVDKNFLYQIIGRKPVWDLVTYAICHQQTCSYLKDMIIQNQDFFDDFDWKQIKERIEPQLLK